MTRRQTSIPEQWLIVDERLGDALWPALSRLPRGSGVLVLGHGFQRRARRELVRRLRRIAAAKAVVVVDEAPRRATRVHNMRELTRALTRRTALILISPIFPTRSHPDSRPMPRMRAATLSRLAKRRVLALGGMNGRRFRSVQKLGFVGWAGISAWIRT